MVHSPDSGFLSLSQLQAMLGARKWLIAQAMAVTFVFTLAAVLFIPRIWTATTDVYIDYKENDPIGGRSFSALLDESYLQTQVDLIQSTTVAERMIADLAILPRSRRAEGDPERDRLITEISKSVQVSSQRSSRVLRVSYAADTPEKARDYANAIVKAYISVSQEMASASARTRNEEYNAQLEHLRREIGTIQEKLTQYQQETGIVDGQQAGDLETRQLNDMTSALLSIDSQVDEARARNQTIDRLLAGGMRSQDLPQISQLTTISQMRDNQTLLDRQLSELSSSLGANHPRVLGLRAEREQLQSRIAAQAKAALDSQRSDLARLEGQRAALQRALEQQRKKVLQQMVQRDQVASYQRQLAGVEQVYNTALQKYDSILMASNISLPNLAVLRAAESPSKPTRPRIRLSLALSLVIGFLAGAALALLLELYRRRLRCEDDLSRTCGLNVIGRIGHPTSDLPAPAL
ncbi:tyrosine kinase [Pigmentiphaga humi]|uniref:Tyrosine kinase n=1 Tax=Pigmentiphaga humi TaxID=2478468 RepID=A0A3P4B8D8_9BURK|nr:Wzz/FepE/Etk N-terminal domain-containing protein [Pigmentiphaga humi]VCU71425.1 tyrosine kinase [Pigmentiphaga humi]